MWAKKQFRRAQNVFVLQMKSGEWLSNLFVCFQNRSHALEMLSVASKMAPCAASGGIFAQQDAILDKACAIMDQRGSVLDKSGGILVSEGAIICSMATIFPGKRVAMDSCEPVLFDKNTAV